MRRLRVFASVFMLVLAVSTVEQAVRSIVVLDVCSALSPDDSFLRFLFDCPPLGDGGGGW